MSRVADSREARRHLDRRRMVKECALVRVGADGRGLVRRRRKFLDYYKRVFDAKTATDKVAGFSVDDLMSLPPEILTSQALICKALVREHHQQMRRICLASNGREETYCSLLMPIWKEVKEHAVMSRNGIVVTRPIVDLAVNNACHPFAVIAHFTVQHPRMPGARFVVRHFQDVSCPQRSLFGVHHSKANAYGPTLPPCDEALTAQQARGRLAHFVAGNFAGAATLVHR